MSSGSGGKARATLLVAHETDVDARAILAEAASQVALGNATAHLRVIINEDTPSDAALWTAEVVDGSGAIRQEQLFTHLAGLGSLAMFRYVALCTRSADGEVAIAIDSRMNALREKTAHLLGDGRPRAQARIGIVGFGDAQVDPRFFSAVADVNLVVIPLDRLQDSSFAQPIQRSDAAVFHTHGAVELLSATGLWRTMEEAPIDHLRTATGGGSDTLVRFSQSRMRLLRTPALPVAGLISEERELPMPDGHQPAPNAAAKLGKADRLLPAELRYEAGEPPQAERQQVDAKDLALLIGREILAALLELPRLVWRVAGGEVGALTRRALQEAVGNDSRYQVLRSEDEPDDLEAAGRAQTARRDMDRRVHEIINDESLATRLDPIPGEIWTSLVSETLGLIDGDPDCAPFRAELLGDEAYLPVDRPSLLRGLDQLPVGIRTLSGSDASARPDASDDEPPPAPTGRPVAVEDAPPTGAPVVKSIAADTPAGQAIVRDARRLEMIRRGWREITARAGTVRKSTDVVYRESEPFDVTGGVLTLRFGAQRSRYTARRAVDPASVAALIMAIEKELGGAPSEVRVLIDGEEQAWDRSIRCDALASMLELEQGRLRVDLNKYRIQDVTPLSVLTAAQLRSILAADRATAPKLHDALSALDRAIPELFASGGLPIDVLRSRMPDAPSAAVGARTDGGEPNTELQRVEVAKVADVGRDDDGLLHRLRAAIVRQRSAASRDIERLVAILREDQTSAPRTTVARSVPIGGALGLLLIVFRLGISDRTIAFLQGREWTTYQLDLWFTISTIIILALAFFLSDVGKRLGGQTRFMVFGAGTLVLLAYVILFFDSLRPFVSGPLRDNRTFALLLGLLTVAFVIYAAVQSWASRSPLRIQGSRVLGLFVVVYVVVGIILLQSQPESWVATRSDEFARRFDFLLLVLGLALIGIALAVITVFRLRESRRLDNSVEKREWALGALADAVEMRELLALAERQWLVTLAALAQIIRRPFGVIADPARSADTLGSSQVLKSASVQLALSDRGVADLEARVRQELIRPSWLRVQYEALVRAHQELLATRSGVPVTSIEGRRPEADIAVPTEQEILAGTGRGDRFEFAELIAAGRLDDVRMSPIAELDIAKVFRPMLAERSVQNLEGFGGRASTVREFFEQVLLENEPRIPDGVVSTALAANEDARHMRAFVWWPQEMLGEPRYPADARVDAFETDLFRRGVIGGAGLVSVRVDVSGEFRYAELVGAVEVDITAMQRAAEAAGRYEGVAGL